MIQHWEKGFLPDIAFLIIIGWPIISWILLYKGCKTKLEENLCPDLEMGKSLLINYFERNLTENTSNAFSLASNSFHSPRARYVLGKLCSSKVVSINKIVFKFFYSSWLSIWKRYNLFSLISKFYFFRYPCTV